MLASKQRQTNPNSISDSESDFSSQLASLINNKPDPLESAAPVIAKWLKRIHNCFRRGTNACFLCAWSAGEVLSAKRQSCVHGNSQAARNGDQTWPDWVAECCPCSEATANRWADIWENVKPENVDIPWNAITYETARELTRVRKNERKLSAERDRARQGNSRPTRRAKPKPQSPKPVTLGTAVSQTIRSSSKLLNAAQIYKEATTESAARETDRLSAHIADLLKSGENILKATTIISQLADFILGSKKSVNVKGRTILEKMEEHFTANHRAILSLMPEDEAE